MKWNWPGIILAAIVFAIVSLVIHTIGAIATMGFYTDPAYFSLWSTLMMPGPNPPGMDFYAYSLAFGFISAVLFSLVYSVVKESIPGKNALQKGSTYGFLLFLVSTVPGTLSMLLLLALPSLLVLEWAVEGLVVFLIGGAVIAKVLK